MTPLLEASGVGVAYGKAAAVRDVALTVGEGQIITVIGPNGAGKSSLLLALIGALPATGTIRYAGMAVEEAALEDRVAAGLALVPERRELFGTMSVGDNLALGAFGRRRDSVGERAAALEEVYGLFPRLKERSRQLASTLSGGERQMLALGRALVGRPRLLMLDEPSLGLAPRIVGEIFRVLVALRERGVSLLVVEQNARAALRIADHGYVLEQGRIVLYGSAAELRGDPRVVATYLGASSDARRPD